MKSQGVWLDGLDHRNAPNISRNAGYAVIYMEYSSSRGRYS
jgi:hypothetical protein